MIKNNKEIKRRKNEHNGDGKGRNTMCFKGQ